MTGPSGMGLTDNMLLLLQQTIEHHEPELLSLARSVGKLPLTEADREALRGAVLSELLSSGLDSEDEPTPYGLELERLIDALGHCWARLAGARFGYIYGPGGLAIEQINNSSGTVFLTCLMTSRAPCAYSPGARAKSTAQFLDPTFEILALTFALDAGAPHARRRFGGSGRERATPRESPRHRFNAGLAGEEREAKLS
jgi:hypothetical protein